MELELEALSLPSVDIYAQLYHSAALKIEPQVFNKCPTFCYDAGVERWTSTF